ncbi:MAG: PDZ domain-containing protein [Planctomycetes bacterium]|nr:PDZ domain-containing protein [Planctomycetota bacterium]
MIRRLSLAALSLFTLALLAHSSAVAQEKDAPKPDLLRQYLSEKDAAKKKELRAKLVALGAPALREAISQLGFEKPKELGSLEFATKCPDGFEHPYFMHVPPQYETGKRYPLVIWLHGGVNGAPAEAASSAIEMWQQALGDKWANEVMVLAPACIAQDTTEDAFWWRDKGQRNVLHMLREVKQRFNVDDNKVFITGMSDGGSGAFGFAGRRPDSFAGYFPLVGHPLVPASDGTRMFWENFKGAKVYAVSGGKDRLYPAKMVAGLVKEANENGASIEHKIYEEAGHDLTFAPKEMPIILEDKIAKWTRDIALKEIDWSTDSAAMGRRAWLAITELAELGDKNAKDFVARPRSPQARVMLGIQISQDAEPTDPVVVEVVAPEGVAEAMGIKEGDTIVKLDDTAVSNIGELREALGKKAPGDEVRVTVERGGKQLELKGKFPKPDAKVDVLARVKAFASLLTSKNEKVGEKCTFFDLTVSNVSKLTIYLTADQVKLGKAIININDGNRFQVDLTEDAELVLAEFERTGDRTLPYVGKIEIDIAKQLGAKVKPVKRPEDEEEEEGF